MSGLAFEGTEEEAGQKLLDVMETIIHTWGLNYNHDELSRYVHGIQLFIWQHALQRTGAACGEWYER